MSPSRLEPQVTIRIALALHSIRAITRAAYAFTDRAYIWFEHDGDDAVNVFLASMDGVSDLRTIDGDFRNSLIDFSVREQIDSETALVRDATVVAALKTLSG